MGTYNWQDISDQLIRLLRLASPAVGMKWIRTKEELEVIPKVRIHEKHLPPCTVVSHAVQYNWTSACLFDNVHANYCRGINGMFPRDERWYSGEMFNNVWFSNIEASRAHNRALECIPPDYIGLVASPLTAGRIEPDVCVLYMKPTQAFLLLAGYQFETYEKLNFSFVGESTCSDSWCKTFLTGKPGLALPCYADKKFAGVADDELRLTFTPEGLVRAVSGLAQMFRTGLRYPIASYSLTTDIIDGLPPHYTQF